MAYLNFSHGGNIWEIRQKYRKEIIDFSANINPLGIPQTVKNALYNNLDKILHYPDSEAKNITKKITKYWGIKEENVLLGNGSIELIYLIVNTFKPRTSLIAIPSFSEYERALKNVKSKIQFLKLKEKENFSLNLCRFNRTDIFFIGNPNNPTGNLILKDRRKARQIKSQLIVVDEAFMDFLPNQKEHTLIWKAVKDKKFIVLRTLTKFFALPGLRIGYLIAHKNIINRLKQYQPPWSTNSLAQLAAEIILNDKKYIKKTYRLIEKEKKFLLRQLAKINGLKPYPSEANYLLIKTEKNNITSGVLRKSLIKKGILIRDCNNFRGLNNKYIRVAVRSHKENLKLIEALRKTIA
jgi:threonine-phosphate decarboxylase